MFFRITRSGAKNLFSSSTLMIFGIGSMVNLVMSLVHTIRCWLMTICTSVYLILLAVAALCQSLARLAIQLGPWLWKYLKAEDRASFVIGEGDVFGTWGSEEDLIATDLIELHGKRKLECCARVRWGRIKEKTSKEILQESFDALGNSLEQKEVYKVEWEKVPCKQPGQKRLGTLGDYLL